MNSRLLTLALAAAALAFATAADARGGRACDGFHGCRCGVTAARYNGLPLNFNGYNLKRAIEFTRALPHTSFQVGTIGYVPHGGPSGHVFSVVGGSDCHSATVHDDAGTYQRNVCGATFMSARGGGGYATASAEEAAPSGRRHRGHRYARHRGQRYAAAAEAQVSDHMAIH